MKEYDKPKPSMTFKQYILNLLLFKYDNIGYNKMIKIGMSLILWADVVGLIIFLWVMIKFYIQLWSVIIFLKDTLCL